jgi:signal transduction histidine kinase
VYGLGVRCDRRRARGTGVTAPDEAGTRLAARLAARTAHDLNNVAAVFSGHIYLLRNQAEPPEEAFEAMEKALEHLGRSTRGLAALGTLGTDAVEPLDINEVIRAVASAGAASAQAIELDLEPGLALLAGRRADLACAVEALLANAREAGASDLPIRLSTRSDSDGAIQIVIEDSGAGVPAEVRRRNFDPFFSTKGEKGRGIGVTLASTVAALQGGSLAVEDRPEGGTRSTLRLPLR